MDADDLARIAGLTTTARDLTRWLNQVNPLTLDGETRVLLRALEAQILAVLRYTLRE